MLNENKLKILIPILLSCTLLLSLSAFLVLKFGDSILILASIVLGTSIILTSCLFFIIRHILKPVEYISEILMEFKSGKGDLSKRCNVNEKFFLKNIVEFFNDFLDNIEEIVIKMNQTSEKVAENSKNLSYKISNIVEGKSLNDTNINSLKNKSEKVLDGVNNQSTATIEMSSNITEISTGLNNVAKNAEETMKLSQNTFEYAKIGGKSISENIEAMKNIGEIVRSIEERSISLGKSSEKIVEIVNFITNISHQTNMLSLNAAIEAQRAGEAGKGFAVVSEEIRKLADRSNNATNEIVEVVEHIKKEIESVISSVKISYKEVQNVTSVSSDTKQKINEIIDRINKTNEEVTSITNSIEEQATSVDEINIATENISAQSSIIGDLADEQNHSFDEISDILRHVLDYSANLSEVSEALKNTARFAKVSSDKQIKVKDLIIWSKDFSVGVTAFDNEHKKLIKIINQLNAAMLDGKSKAQLKNIIGNLIDYTANHFQHEEKIFKKYNYPEQNEHKKQHDKLVEKVLQVKADIDNGKAMVSVELINFLKSWLMEHINGSDKKYGRYFNDKGIEVDEK